VGKSRKTIIFDEDEDQMLPEEKSFRLLAKQAGYDPDDPLDHELLIEREKERTQSLLQRSCESNINRKHFKEVFLRA
jgi:hypothetical protein